MSNLQCLVRLGKAEMCWLYVRGRGWLVHLDFMLSLGSSCVMVCVRCVVSGLHFLWVTGGNDVQNLILAELLCRLDRQVQQDEDK